MKAVPSNRTPHTQLYKYSMQCIQNFKHQYLKPGIHLRQRQAEARHSILDTPRRRLKNVFQICEAQHVPSILRIKRGIPRACLTLIYQHVMARFAAASEACGLARCSIYTSRGEVAAPHLSLPLPQVYSQLQQTSTNFLSRFVNGNSQLPVLHQKGSSTTVTFQLAEYTPRTEVLCWLYTPSTIRLWTASTDKKLKINKPPVTSPEIAKLKDEDLGEDYLSFIMNKISPKFPLMFNEKIELR